MSNVLEEKLNKVKDAYENLKIRAAAKDIWIYRKTPLDDAFSKIMDLQDEEVIVDEMAYTVSIEDNSATVITNIATYNYTFTENEIQINDSLYTGDAYNVELKKFLKYTFSNPSNIEQLLADKFLVDIIKGSEFLSNELLNYYIFNLKYQCIAKEFSDCIVQMNDCVSIIDDEFIGSVAKPRMSAVKNIMISTSDMFNPIGDNLNDMFAATNKMFENQDFLYYVKRLSNYKEVIYKLIKETNSNLLKSLPESYVDEYIEEYPDTLGGLLDNIFASYLGKSYNLFNPTDGLKYLDFYSTNGSYTWDANGNIVIQTGGRGAQVFGYFIIDLTNVKTFSVTASAIYGGGVWIKKYDSSDDWKTISNAVDNCSDLSGVYMIGTRVYATSSNGSRCTISNFAISS